MEAILPEVKNRPGIYLYRLFGDNLASHFNLEVVKVAEQNSVHFVMLPPNSTCILQPLYVAVFSSLKRSWRIIFDEWEK